MSTLAELIRERKAQTDEVMSSKFTSEEKRHFSNLLLERMPNRGETSVYDNIYEDNCLFDGNRINSRRKSAFLEWLKDEGLYYHLGFNSCITVYTVERLDDDSKADSIYVNEDHRVLFNETRDGYVRWSE